MRIALIILLLAILVSRCGDGDAELEQCRAEVELLQGGREVVQAAAEAALELGRTAHAHGLICRHAYRACRVEGYIHESQAGQEVADPGVQRDGAGLPGSGG